MLSLSQLFHSPLTFITKLFSSSSLSAIRVVSSAYLRLLIFLPAILLPACASSSSVSHDVPLLQVHLIFFGLNILWSNKRDTSLLIITSKLYPKWGNPMQNHFKVMKEQAQIQGRLLYPIIAFCRNTPRS